MKNDTTIMGLCGETRITNKLDSFWTAIQVYEYFISHHFGKSFESVFGGVTCLPGCFSMYRIKVTRPGDAMVIPLLVCPEVVEEYAVGGRLSVQLLKGLAVPASCAHA
jgi:chitin synthase